LEGRLNSAAKPNMSGGLIFKNGRFTTLDRSSASASAVAITDGPV